MNILISCLYFFSIRIFQVSVANIENRSQLKPCPRIHSDLIVDIDRLLGNWHLAMIIMDENGEEFEERSLCVRGKISRLNSTMLLQVWTINVPEIFKERNTELDFPTTIITPGIWVVQSPLGGELKAIIIDSRRDSNLLMMYCGWYEGTFVHIITVALTREDIVTPKHRLQLLSSFVQNGYDPYHNKIISWSDC